MFRKFIIRIRRPRRRSIRSKQHYEAHKEQARVLIAHKLASFAAQYPFPVHSFSVRNQKTRWGSCSRRGHLSFHYRILFLPEHLQDYIIVHELCHIKEMNHSKRFWALVEVAIPHWRQARTELKSHRLV